MERGDELANETPDHVGRCARLDLLVTVEPRSALFHDDRRVRALGDPSKSKAGDVLPLEIGAIEVQDVEGRRCHSPWFEAQSCKQILILGNDLLLGNTGEHGTALVAARNDL